MKDANNKKVVWPFPTAGQIKRAPTENDRVKVENKQTKRDKKEALKELGDALI